MLGALICMAAQPAFTKKYGNTKGARRAVYLSHCHAPKPRRRYYR